MLSQASLLENSISILFCSHKTLSLYVLSITSQTNTQRNYLFFDDEKHRKLRSASLPRQCLEFVIQQALCQKLLGDAKETWAVWGGIRQNMQYAITNQDHSRDQGFCRAMWFTQGHPALLFHAWTCVLMTQLFAHTGRKLWLEME